jgi:hypothetical protein
MKAPWLVTRFNMDVRSNDYQYDVALWVELGGGQLCCHGDGSQVFLYLGFKSEG